MTYVYQNLFREAQKNRVHKLSIEQIDSYANFAVMFSKVISTPLEALFFVELVDWLVAEAQVSGRSPFMFHLIGFVIPFSVLKNNVQNCKFRHFPSQIVPM